MKIERKKKAIFLVFLEMNFPGIRMWDGFPWESNGVAKKKIIIT